MKLRHILYTVSFMAVLLPAFAELFQSVVTLPAGVSPRGIAVGDLSGTGIENLVVANFGAPTFIGQSTAVSLRNPQDSNFQVFSSSPIGLKLMETIAVGLNPRGISLFDLDGDGHKEILVTAYGADLLQVFSLKDGRFLKSDEMTTLKMPVGVTTGRVKAGGVAFVAASDFGSNSISLFPAVGGKLGSRVDVRVDEGPVQAAVGDLNGDGMNEIAVACLASGKIDLLSPGTGNEWSGFSYILTRTISLPVGSSPSDLRVTDLNGDGKADLVVVDFAKNTLFLYFQQTDGSLLAQPSLTTSGSHPNGLTVADLEGDHKKEILVANRDSDSIDIFGLEAGQFQLTRTVKLAEDKDPTFGPVELGVLDIQGDGVLDIVASHMRTNSLKIVSGSQVNNPGINSVSFLEADQSYSLDKIELYPNPSNDGKVNVRLRLKEPAKVSIQVFDLTGTLVWTRSYGPSETRSGENVLRWTGVNQTGENLVSGLYLIRIAVGAESVVKKVALIR